MGAERGAVPMTPHVVGVGERTRWRERPPDQVGAAVARMTQQIRRTKMKRNKLRWMAPLLALAFIATACGNDDDDPSTGDDGAAEPAGDDRESCIGEEEIGRRAWRERVCSDGWVGGVAGTLKK